MNSKLANILTLVLVALVRVDGSEQERFLAIPQTLVTLVMTVGRVGGRQERYPAVNPQQTISRPNYGRPPPYGRPSRPGEDTYTFVLPFPFKPSCLYQAVREVVVVVVTSLAMSSRASSSTSLMQSSSGLGL